MSVAELSTALAEQIREETGENVFACYQCNKCTSGCPLASHFDLAPNQVLRAAQLGMDERVLESRTPWLCIGCETCTTRCPNGIDVARVMDFMAAESQVRGITPKIPEVAQFSEIFLRHVKHFGRSYELGLVAEMNLRSGNLFKDLSMGLAMIRKGKLRFTPEFARGKIPASTSEKKPNQVGYYPGCSLHSLAAEYDSTVRAVTSALDIELVEPRGWVCCGSSPAHRVAPRLAVELPMQNLALLEQTGVEEVAVPCSACFNRLRTAQREVEHNPVLKQQTEAKIGFVSERKLNVRTIVDVIADKMTPAALAAKATHPLTGLKVACYYGCLMTRAPAVTGADEPEYPMMLDRLVAALGATPVDWGHKTSCCGASLSVTRTEIALDLSRNILDDARNSGADVVVVACPLCHTNLDDRQPQIYPEAEDGTAAGRVPVLYFTQLMALAFGMGDKAAALGKNMIDPRPVLTQLGVID